MKRAQDEAKNQLELDFTGSSLPGHESPDHFEQWRAEMRALDNAEARRLGLPLRRRVEVQLASGKILQGRLLLAEPELLRIERRSARLTLCIGDFTFDLSQIARCLVLDDAPQAGGGSHHDRAAASSATSPVLDAPDSSSHTALPQS